MRDIRCNDALCAVSHYVENPAPFSFASFVCTLLLSQSLSQNPARYAYGNPYAPVSGHLGNARL